MRPGVWVCSRRRQVGIMSRCRRGRCSITPQLRHVEVDLSGVFVERVRQFGGPWLALQLIGKLGLKAELDRLMPVGREDVPWSMMSLVLVICRLCDPSSELRIAEHLYERSALVDLLGVSAEKINDDRLYRALDELLPHKADLEKHLKNRLGELFNLTYDLLLYDVTSTYFEGQCAGNDQARRGYSRDNRGDCKQLCIALVVSRAGMPVGYELFAGNKADVTTVKEIVTTMEERYGTADRIWVMDRGMVSAANVEFLKEGNRRYIMGTHKTLLRRYEKQLIASDWNAVHDGLEVKLCADPDGGTETFILCRSAARREKEKAMHEKFEKRIEDGLTSLVKLAEKRSMTAVQISHRVGRLLGQNTRAAGAFKTEVITDAAGKTSSNGKRSRRGGPGQDSAKAATCCAATSATGRLRNYGAPTCNSPKPSRRSESTKAICQCVRSGIRKKSECRPMCWSAFLRTCSGKPWVRCASPLALATNPEKCWMRSPPSKRWT